MKKLYCVIYYHNSAIQLHGALHTGYSNEISSSFSTWREARDIPTTRTGNTLSPRRCEQTNSLDWVPVIPTHFPPPDQHSQFALRYDLMIQGHLSTTMGADWNIPTRHFVVYSFSQVPRSQWTSGHLPTHHPTVISSTTALLTLSYSLPR